MNGKTSHLDMSRLNELQELFQADFGDALTSFLDNSKSYMQSIAEGLRDSNAKAVEMNAHKLKSSTAMFGAMIASALALDMEAAARSGDLKAATALNDRFIQAFAEAKSEWTTLPNP